MPGHRTERNVNIERFWYEGSPYLYAATGIAAATHARGSLLMSGQAGAYAVNAQFQLKMALMR